MDPDENLAEMRRIAERATRDCALTTSDDIERMAELFLALDRWLSHKGFLPKAWTR